MKKIVLYIMLFCCITVLKAQNAAVDFNQVRAQFLNAEQIGFEVEVYRYPTQESKGELLSKGIMRKDGANYYSSFMNDKMIINKKRGTVIIDEADKEITYFSSQKEVKRPVQIELPDSLFEEFKLISKTDQIKKYEYKDNNPQAAIIKTHLHINNKHQLVKVIYYYNKNTKEVSYDAYKVEINYKNIITEKISSSYFDISKYVHIKDNKAQLNKQYSDYTLLN